MISTAEFEQARPTLLSVAYRIVGAAQDAEDAVQTAWLRTQAAHTAAIDNPSAWLTTVVSRVCLDQLRERRRRDALGRQLTDGIDTAIAAADEAMLRREDVSRALLMLMRELTPPQRVAYVLHDLFSLPFDTVAAVLDITPAAAKKHASRARARLSPPAPGGPQHRDDRQHREIVDAFLHAARGGDIARMTTLLAPDCVRRADPALLPRGAATTVRGAAAVAEETRSFVDRIRVSAPMRVDGHPVDVIAPGGHPWALIDIATTGGVITEINLRPVRPADRFYAL
ncbi:RNA polymerase subunit sigma-70 [Mycolicibacterium duvalii]|uniref:Putative RNA polymerase sigma factor n=1 Tax=Mycolicibacterium duvalii TaxID=39688 RepID=A0A7I7KAE6_9MYCO|nr:sigma-70 family RNA polymerase sigma factor [Mycolicibacterium duvalii]MCV7368454.1 sigma-70 family RNA polymerase sigma factor [Mycolicibacterium duvalii]PEG41874.1 RNA polymerase subunit sigma-70 [Mycolicibacterium duvalii]BBX20559.1 putative RNA polymerase sigma factor [Mycolicibacterium duvalii]